MSHPTGKSADVHLDRLRAELRRASRAWTEGYLVRLYEDSRRGLGTQADEAAILGEHGYITQSSELAREGSLMVAYVKSTEAGEYGSLERPGLEAASDPYSLTSRFARPLAWLVVAIIIAFAFWLLLMALG